MHDLQFIRKNSDYFIDNMQLRGLSVDLSELLNFDLNRRDKIENMQKLQSRKNLIVQQIASLRIKKIDVPAGLINASLSIDKEISIDKNTIAGLQSKIESILAIYWYRCDKPCILNQEKLKEKK